VAKVVTLGEIMLRLSTPGFERFVQSKSFDVNYGGGEANVAVALSKFGHDVHFVTKLPKNEIGEAAANELKRYGVNTDDIKYGEGRMGIYFLETGASMRPSKVVYDRANSAIALAKPEDFNFDQIFENCDWFHFSGITPALSVEAREVTKQACIAAKRHGVTISVDLNYRKKLWSTKEAQSVMIPLMEYVDVCIGNEEDADTVLGIAPDKTDVISGEVAAHNYHNLFKKMEAKFNFKVIATTLRVSYSASKNGWSSLLYKDGSFYESKYYTIDPIVDRVGGGDSFSAGLIHGLLSLENQDAIEFATAASALKQTIPGDFNHVSIEEINYLCLGNASGRVDR